MTHNLSVISRSWMFTNLDMGGKTNWQWRPPSGLFYNSSW